MRNHDLTRQGRRPWIGALGFGLLLCAAGCATIEPLTTTGNAQTFGPYWGRAYFQRRTSFGTTVMVCDVRQNDVVCYDAPNGSGLGQ